MRGTIHVGLLFLACTLTPFVRGEDHAHVHKDSFPSERDEYDFGILDPNSLYGSPYGGFGRAITSRLASIPLHLPYLSDAYSVDDEPLYMEVRDAKGRLFGCRVYHEDELEPGSIGESMFDAPRLRVATQEEEQGRKDDMDSSKEEPESRRAEESVRQAGRTSAEEQVVRSTDKADGQRRDAETQDSDKAQEEVYVYPDGRVESMGKSAMTSIAEEVAEKTSADQSASRNQLALHVEERLSKLEGLCGVIHLGWWSYEWCYQSHVSQFHLQINSKNDKSFSVQDFTKLGTFARRTIEFEFDDDDPNPLAEDRPEMARVTDMHIEGDICPDKDEPRAAMVELVCCSENVMMGRKGDLTRAKDHDDAKNLNRHLAAIHSVFESDDPEEICLYIVTICTPLLCLDEEEPDLDSKIESNDTPKTKSKKKKKENESVREILERTLGDQCLQTSTGGWWTYEFCHSKRIRQYHEVIGQHKVQSGASYATRVIESEHILGKYQKHATESSPDEDEWKSIVNATDKASGGGNGAYYEVEYADGDICDNSDVTDAAIIAGGSGSGGIARSSTVRYLCGNAFNVAVNEDSTCHYIVEVTVPDLCEHVLFRAPMMKKQVVKCLPIEDDDPLWSE